MIIVWFVFLWPVLYRPEKFLWQDTFCIVRLPVVVSSNTPDTDAADWLRVQQATIIWVNQGQHAVLKHQQHPFTLQGHKRGHAKAALHNLEDQDSTRGFNMINNINKLSSFLSKLCFCMLKLRDHISLCFNSLFLVDMLNAL